MAWLRARDLNVNKAEAMIRKSFEWRKVNKIDTLLTSWTPPAEYVNKFAFEISGYDKEECPIIIVPFGNWDVRTAVDEGNGKTFLKYNQILQIAMVDDAKLKMRQQDKYISQFNGIFDMSGFSLRQVTSMACIEVHMESVRQYEDNYPETLKSAYVVNAPRIFAILFNIIKPLLTARTLNKIQIFDSNEAKWKEALLNNFPADQLPAEYGGTKKATMQIKPNSGELYGTDDDNMIKVVISPGRHLNLEFNVDMPNSQISWKFKTEHFDIGFCVKDGMGREVVQFQRVDAWKSVYKGKYLVERTGKYTLVFDNRYSLLRCKNVHYSVALKKPI
jgi:hypothetical protein